MKSLKSGIMGNISEGDRSSVPQALSLWQELTVEEKSDKIFGIQAQIKVETNSKKEGKNPKRSYLYIDYQKECFLLGRGSCCKVPWFFTAFPLGDSGKTRGGLWTRL